VTVAGRPPERCLDDVLRLAPDTRPNRSGRGDARYEGDDGRAHPPRAPEEPDTATKVTECAILKRPTDSSTTESPRAGQEHLRGGVFTGSGSDGPSKAEPALSRIGADGDAEVDSRTPRWPLAVITAGVVTLFLLQAPGRLIADTKMDVPLDPLRFMERATHLWNSSSDFGFLPNQYIGYLFPMGPFFLIGKLAHVPPWITQRLWMALIVTVAVWGTVRLADALRIGRPITRVAAGLAYGLSPVFLGKIGVSSIALTGPAMLPWITLPLVLALRTNSDARDTDAGTDDTGGRRRRALSPRRAAALSGLAIVCTGGVNASVTLCVLLCPAALLLLAGRTRRVWALRAWWMLAVILATTWWLVALFTQLRFGLNFLPYTESAATTTSTTSVAEALRGTTDWLEYLRVPSPWLPAATVYVTNAAAIAGTAVTAGLGLWGLARRDLPARKFLLLSFVVGIVAVSAAFPGVPGSPLAGVVRHLLAGPFGFLRNVYKFEAVAHLPMTLGLAHALQVALDARGRRRAERPAAAALSGAGASPVQPRGARRPRLASAVAIVAVVAALGTGTTPALTGQLSQKGTFTGVPEYWHEAADWLADNPAGGRTLVLPASPFASYDWGRPLDEPMSWLSSTPWASRALVPLGNVGMIRWMDAIEQELSLGSAPGLVAALARAGVGQVLIRNDLDDQNWDIPPSTSEIYRALASSGLRHAASFGPMVFDRAGAKDRLIPSLANPTGKVPALDVWVVPGGASPVSAYPADSTVVVSGGAEATVQLAAHGLLGPDQAVVLASDLAGPGAAASDPSMSSSGGLVQALPASEIIGPTTTMVATDTFTRRDTQFGVVHDGTSYLLGAGEVAAGEDHPPKQWIDVPPDGHQTVAAYTGGVTVRASSYGSSLVTEPDVAPAAAVDGLPYTFWTLGPVPGKGSVGGWIEIDVPRAVNLPYLDVQLLEEGTWRPAVRTIRVTTQRGSVVTQVRADESTQRLAVPAGPSTSFRVTFETVTRQGDDTYGAGIRELTLPGVPIEHYAQVPSDAAALFATGQGQVAYAFDREAVDVTQPFGGSEELILARRFDVPRAMNFTFQGTMTAIPSALTSGRPNEPFELACGAGPALTVDGTRYNLRVDGVQADLTDARPLKTSVCTPDGTIPLSAGQHLLTVDSGGSLLTSSVSLIGTNASLTTDQPRGTTVGTWGDERRTVHIGAGTRAILAVHQNSNASWTATLNGQTLTPIRLDGWQQGWIVPAGSGGTIMIVNSPGHEYRVLLVVGGVLLLVLAAIAVLPARRRARRGAAAGGSSPRPRDPERTLASARGARIPPVIAGGALATLAVFLVAGPMALAVPLFILVGRPRSGLLPWAGLAFMIAAGVGVIARSDALPGSGSGAFSWYVQGAGALAFAATAATIALGSSRPGPAGESERPVVGVGERPAVGDPAWPAADVRERPVVGDPTVAEISET